MNANLSHSHHMYKLPMYVHRMIWDVPVFATIKHDQFDHFTQSNPQSVCALAEVILAVRLINGGWTNVTKRGLKQQPDLSLNR